MTDSMTPKPLFVFPSTRRGHIERLLNAAARSAALQAFLPLRPYTVRRPVPTIRP